MFCIFCITKDDLIYHEEDHHGDASIEDGGANIIQPAWDKRACDCHPDAVDGVDHTGDHTKRQQVPHSLVGNVALGSENPASLNKEVDDLTDNHGDHIGGKVGNTALLRTVADDVPLKLNAEQVQIDAGETEISASHEGKGSRQEGQQHIFKHGDHIAHQHKQAALPDPLGQFGIFFDPFFDYFHINHTFGRMRPLK